MTNIAETYHTNGYAFLESLIPAEIAAGMTYQLQVVISKLGAQALAAPRVNEKTSYELYSYHWAPMTTFLWAMTPIIERATNLSLLPTYGFFRTYQKDDICKIHADRASCEHSLSLTIGYADDKKWALSVEKKELEKEQYFNAGHAADYGNNDYAAFPMKPGDAVLYKGIEHRHGRLEQNPNAWSAHLFLHWVDRNGPYAAQAFDGQKVSTAGDFIFPEA